MNHTTTNTTEGAMKKTIRHTHSASQPVEVTCPACCCKGSFRPDALFPGICENCGLRKDQHEALKK
jgi:hypothetical protein